jgi:MFS family permease
MTPPDPLPLATPALSADRAASLALASVCFALFAAATSMSCVFAILPSVGRDLGLSEPQIGWVVAPAAMVFVLFGPVWGRLGRHWPARGIFTAALLMVAVFTLLFGFALVWRLEARISVSVCFALLIASRVLLSPFSAAMLPTAQSYIAHTTDSTHRPRALASMGASFALGMVASPGLAAIATGGGLLTPFYVVAILLVAAAACTWTWLPRGHHDSSTATHASVAKGHPRTEWALIWHPLAILALIYTVYGILMQVAGFRMRDQLHLDAHHATQHAGIVLMAIAAALVATQMTLARVNVSASRTQRRIVLIAGVIGLLGLVMLITEIPFRAQLLCSALFGLSLGALMPFTLNDLAPVARSS